MTKREDMWERLKAAAAQGNLRGSLEFVDSGQKVHIIDRWGDEPDDEPCPTCGTPKPPPST
jgi:hypothetical protein